ncbi:MAG: Asp-tRNA(Asn)/Glu-tRNA(Gln) amidotransferase subunit GatA [Rickettsiaceae bacterium]|nr:Asp-tRNA(Asn)/Glu-tRNA(Gln) amidotransferase subunit GatA [Rickettsiaceae bacterium]
MSELVKLSLHEALEGYAKKDFSVFEVVSANINQAQKHKKLNVFITENFEKALSDAKNSDILYAKKEARKLEGATIAVKDLFCTKGIRTTSGSKMLGNFIPPYESEVSNKIKEAGAISLGKTNMDEFAMGSGNVTSYYGPVINPWKSSEKDEDLVPGGSSGGSSACVSGYMSMGALGSDTGGSVRQPAAFTGTVGIKPTYGRCSRYGMVAFSSSLDQAGIFARNCKDAALILENMMGFDPKDSTSSNEPIPPLSSFDRNIKGMKIGIPRDIMQYDGISEEILNMWQNSVDALKGEGAEIVDVNLPHSKYALATYYVVASAEASSNLSRYDGVRYGHRTGAKVSSLDELYELTRAEGFGTEVKRRIMIGAYVLSSGFMDAYYLKAQKIRKKISDDFRLVFEGCQGILLPSAPTPAFGLKEKQDDPVTMYLNDIFTIPASLAGLPAMSVPAGFSGDQLPLGMQIISNAFDEMSMIRFAGAIESSLKLNLNPRGF